MNRKHMCWRQVRNIVSDDHVINVWKTVAMSSKIKTKKRRMFPKVRGSQEH